MTDEPHDTPNGNPGSDVAALVLAGGHSRRFGADKARHPVAGRPMIRRAYETARAVVAGPVLVSIRAGQEYFAALPPEGEGEGEEPRVRYVEDAMPEAGPLAGLVAGLRATGAAWLLALACDLPFVAPGVLLRLLEARTPEADAVVAEAPGGRRQPLCACYRCAATRPLAEAHLRDERLALHALLDALRVRDVPVAASALRNVNRPGDLPSGGT